MRKRIALGIAAIWGLLILAIPSPADTYDFVQITSNRDYFADPSQFTVEVLAVVGSPNQVSFTFYNAAGGVASSITDIYFEDGTLLGIASITDSGEGVAFNSPANPEGLPGGNLAYPFSFTTTEGFSADADPPTAAQGVNPGEWVQITFNLIDDNTFDDVIAALNKPITEAADLEGSLRIGLHIQAFPGGSSQSFVNDTPGPGPGPLPVPETTSLLLLGSGLIGLAGVGYKGRKR